MTTEREVQRGFRIQGRVQGVFFRAWTQSVAGELGLRGTVRNRRDGSVEAQVAGPPDAVETLKHRLWEGPPSAMVNSVEVFESEEELPAGDFQILPTG